MTNGWKDISTAPKDRYIEITDGICIQDTVHWQPESPEKIDGWGTRRLSQPAGWFAINGGRSRLDGKAQYWAELRPLPKGD